MPLLIKKNVVPCIADKPFSFLQTIRKIAWSNYQILTPIKTLLTDYQARVNITTADEC
jgi:hypothetical protein